MSQYKTPVLKKLMEPNNPLVKKKIGFLVNVPLSTSSRPAPALAAVRELGQQLWELEKRMVWVRCVLEHPDSSDWDSCESSHCRSRASGLEM